MVGRYVIPPVRLPVAEFAALTDWQLEHLYRKAAEREKAEYDRLARGGRPDPPPAAGEGGMTMPTDREEFVAWWRAVNGGGREEALRRFAEEFPDGDAG